MLRCLKNVHVGCGMVKSMWPQEEMRTRLEQKKFIILTNLREWVTACHGAVSQGKALVWVRKQKERGKVWARAFTGQGK